VNGSLVISTKLTSAPQPLTRQPQLSRLTNASANAVSDISLGAIYTTRHDAVIRLRISEPCAPLELPLLTSPCSLRQRGYIGACPRILQGPNGVLQHVVGDSGPVWILDYGASMPGWGRKYLVLGARWRPSICLLMKACDAAVPMCLYQASTLAVPVPVMQGLTHRCWQWQMALLFCSRLTIFISMYVTRASIRGINRPDPSSQSQAGWFLVQNVSCSCS
jgi:hypothetical protein